MVRTEERVAASMQLLDALERRVAEAGSFTEADRHAIWDGLREAAR